LIVYAHRQAVRCLTTNAMLAGGQLGRARTGTSAALSRKGADASTQKPHKTAALQQCTSTALAGLRPVLHLRPPPAARSRSPSNSHASRVRAAQTEEQQHARLQAPGPAPQTDAQHAARMLTRGTRPRLDIAALPPAAHHHAVPVSGPACAPRGAPQRRPGSAEPHAAPQALWLHGRS